MDRYTRFGPTDRDKRATTVATDSSSPLFCSFDELGYCWKFTSKIVWKTDRWTSISHLDSLAQRFFRQALDSLRRLARKERLSLEEGQILLYSKENALLSTFITYLDPEESRVSAHVFTKRIKPLRAGTSWKDQTKQEIGSDEGERELLLMKEGESLLLMNRIFYWNRIHNKILCNSRIHSNRWTEPEPTCCSCFWPRHSIYVFLHARRSTPQDQSRSKPGLCWSFLEWESSSAIDQSYLGGIHWRAAVGSGDEWMNWMGKTKSPYP